MSPRRSSRAARSSANPPTASQTASSTSSVTLKNNSTLRRSVSVEDIEDQDDEKSTEPAMPRRSRRTGAEDSRDVSQSAKPTNGFDATALGEEDPEEVTRCICGELEYPGPTTSLRHARGEVAIDLNKQDMGDFFVQCDKCLVWQHGGCVGFQDEVELPDEYFCELCKPKLHKIYKENDRRRSHYFTSRQLGKVNKVEPPAVVVEKVDHKDASRSSSLSSGEPRKKDSKKAAAAMSEATKRRATMNSRGAYDEDEMLRRAIEESNRESSTLGKRGRDVNDDSKQALKRQRTGSISSGSKRSNSPTATDDPNKPPMTSRAALRSVAAKNKEIAAREKAKREQAAIRAAAASNRHARSERRRGDDSPPPSPSISPAKGPSGAANKTTNGGKSDPPNSTGKAKSKAPARKTVNGRRVGANQYTVRNRDPADADTPGRDASDGSGGRGSPANGANGNAHGNHNDTINGKSGRSSKAKTHPARTSLNEMKRRVAAILEFVGMMQTHSTNTNGQKDLKGKGGNSSGSEKDGNNGDASTPSAGGAVQDPTTAGAAGGVAGLVKAVLDAAEDITAAAAAAADGTTSGSASSSAAEGEVTGGGGAVVPTTTTTVTKPKFRDDTDLKDMGSAEMMEALTRELIAWQRVYGVYSR